MGRDGDNNSGKDFITLDSSQHVSEFSIQCKSIKWDWLETKWCKSIPTKIKLDTTGQCAVLYVYKTSSSRCDRRLFSRDVNSLRIRSKKLRNRMNTRVSFKSRSTSRQYWYTFYFKSKQENVHFWETLARNGAEIQEN